MPPHGSALDWTLRQTTGEGLSAASARGYLEGWLEAQAGGRTLAQYREQRAAFFQDRRGTVGPTSWVRYEQTVRRFLDSLGKKAQDDLANVPRMDIDRARDGQAARVSPATANLMLKILRTAFRAAAPAKGARRKRVGGDCRMPSVSGLRRAENGRALRGLADHEG